jgi:hypothetical protein
LRYQRELKARQKKNPGKARGGSREPKKPPKGGGGGKGSDSNKSELFFALSDAFPDFSFGESDYEPSGLGNSRFDPSGESLSLEILLGSMSALDNFWLQVPVR